MEKLFTQYWWLLFPLGWFIASGWQSLLNYRRHRDVLDLVRDYAKNGKEIPPGLLDKLNAPREDDDWNNVPDRREERRYRRRNGFGGWSQVVLFGSLAAGFAYAAATDIYEAGPAFVIVTFVMGAMCLASLVATLTGRPKD